ncbi:Volume-regulated anion channel subunit LRRC8E, partial [Durusdinium trenchii]
MAVVLAVMLAVLLWGNVESQGTVLVKNLGKHNEMRLGVHETGHLIYDGVGLKAFNADPLLEAGAVDAIGTVGRTREGWGVQAVLDDGADTVIDLFSNNWNNSAVEAQPIVVSPVDGRAFCQVDGADAFTVKHVFDKGSSSDRVFDITISITNTSPETWKSLAYRRIADIDPGSSAGIAHRYSTGAFNTSDAVTLLASYNGILCKDAAMVGAACDDVAGKRYVSAGADADDFLDLNQTDPLLEPSVNRSVELGYRIFETTEGVGLDIDVALPNGGLRPGRSVTFKAVVGAAPFLSDLTTSLNGLDVGIRMGSANTDHSGLAYGFGFVGNKGSWPNPTDDICRMLGCSAECHGKMRGFDSSFNPIKTSGANPGCQICDLEFDSLWLDNLSKDPEPLKPQRLSVYNSAGVVDCSNSYAFAILWPDKSRHFVAPMKQDSGSVCVVDWEGVFDKPSDLNKKFKIVFGLNKIHLNEQGNRVRNTRIWVDDASKAVVDHVITIEELTEPAYIVSEFSVIEKDDVRNGYEATVVLSEGLYSRFGDDFSQSCSFPSQINVKLDGKAGAETNPECTKVCTQTSSGDDSATFKCDLDINDVGTCGVELTANFRMGMAVEIPFQSAFFGGSLPTGAEQDWCFHGEILDYMVNSCNAPVPGRPMVRNLPFTLLLSKTGDVGDTTENQGNELTQLIVTIDGPPDFVACEGFTPTAQMVLPVRVDGFDQQKMQDFLIDLADDLAAPVDDTYPAFALRVPISTVNGDTMELVAGSVDVGCDGSVEGENYAIPDNGVVALCFKLVTTTCQPMNLFSGSNGAQDTCEFNKVGFADVEVETCCEFAELKRTVVPDSPIFTENCPDPDNQVDVTPDFDISFRAFCPDPTAGDNLYLNADMAVQVEIAGLAGDETDVSTSLVVDEIEVELYDYDDDGKEISYGYRYFARQWKTRFMDDPSDSYYDDGHFCRVAPTINSDGTPNAISDFGISEYNPTPNTCVPFYRVSQNQNPLTLNQAAPYDDDYKGYVNCQPMSERNIDRFIFVPNKWIYDRFEGVRGFMRINATATLTGCDDPTTRRRVLRNGDRDLQPADIPRVVFAQQEFKLVNDDDFATCGGRSKKKCKKQCQWVSYLAGDNTRSSGCMTKTTLDSYECSEVLDSKSCGAHSGCSWNGKSCVEAPTECSDYTQPKTCNKDKYNVGTQCKWVSTVGCMEKAEIDLMACEELPGNGLCTASPQKCMVKKKKCMANTEAASVSECGDYTKKMGKKKCNRDEYQ